MWVSDQRRSIFSPENRIKECLTLNAEARQNGACSKTLKVLD